MAKKKKVKFDSEKPITIKSKTLFDHINQITQKFKKDWWEKCSDIDKKTFSPYMVNRFLSMNVDWLPYINEFQKYTIGLLRPKEVYRLYYEIIPKGKIYLNYVKSKSSNEHSEEIIELLIKYYECSSTEAKEYYDIMMSDINGREEILELLNLYGIQEKEKNKIIKKIGI